MSYNLAIKSENIHNTNEGFFPEDKIIKNLYRDLTKGDVISALKTYEEYSQNHDTEIFLRRIFAPTANMVFSRFLENKISPATQHVAVNVSTFLTRKIIEKISTKGTDSNEF